MTNGFLNQVLSHAAAKSRVAIAIGVLVAFAMPMSALARTVPKRVTAKLTKELGVDVPVVVRSALELRRVFENNPFLRRKIVSVDHLHVGFLDEKPTRTQLNASDPERSPGDGFEVSGREVYLHCPNGIARSELMVACFDRVLGDDDPAQREDRGKARRACRAGVVERQPNGSREFRGL